MAQTEIRVGLIGSKLMGMAHSNAFRNVGIWLDLPVKIAMKAVAARDPQGLPANSVGKAAKAIGGGWWPERISIWSVSPLPEICIKKWCSKQIRHGKHVICEKPLANSLEDAQEMLEAARSAGVRDCCSFSCRSTPSQALAR